VRPEVPWELAAVVGKMMAKDPGRRYQTPGEVAEALKSFFRQGEAALARSQAEVSLVGQAAADQPVVRARPVAAQPATNVTPAAPQLAAKKSLEPPLPESMQRNLIEIAETEPLTAPVKPLAPAGVRSSPPWLWPVVAGGILLLGLLSAWAAEFFKVKTENGVIVLENVPENAVVQVDGQRVPVTASGHEPVKIGIRPGTHGVVVKQGNGVLLAESVIVESGKAARATVPKFSKVPAKDAVLVLESVPANAVVEVDGEKIPVSSSEGRPLRIELRRGTHGVLVKQGKDLLLGKSVMLESGTALKLPVPVKETAKKQTPPSSSAPPVAQKRTADWISPSAKMEFVRIEGDEFMMGSPDGNKDISGDEKPPHKVRISPLYLGVTEVTQAQYQAVTGNNPSWFSSTGGGRAEVAGGSTDRLPVEQVSWLDAIRFCNALSKKDGKSAYYHIAGKNVQVPNPKGPGYRLPTEAEWEYACRAGKGQSTHSGTIPRRWVIPPGTRPTRVV